MLCSVTFCSFDMKKKPEKNQFTFYNLFTITPPNFPPTVYLFQPGLTRLVHSIFAWIYFHPSYIQNFIYIYKFIYILLTIADNSAAK